MTLPQPWPAPVGIDSLVSHDVPVFSPDARRADVLEELSRRDGECVDDVVVCDSAPTGRLRGLVPLGRLLTAPTDVALADLMDRDPAVIAPGLDFERAAWKAVHHGETSLAVVDQDGVFVGLVPPARLIGQLLREHDQDFARLGGYLATTAHARVAVEEPVARRLWHRMPWLLLGLAGAAVSAWLVGLFGDRLEADVRLAFFIPGVVYMADAVGTQTEALVIRGLSVGAPMRRVWGLEVVTGPATGALFAAVSVPLVWGTLGSLSLALTVSLALFAACSVATVVAVSLPWVMQRRGMDPAFGSGPLATVVQDLLSLVIYLGAALLVPG